MVSERERGEGVESSERSSVWAVVLAGGVGTKLRPLVRHVCGDERPKQFSPLLGARTLLRQTLDRVGRLIPPERTVVVTLQAHARYLERELEGKPRPHVLSQPEGRGTAAGILLAAQWIEMREPGATLVSFPSDHLVLEEVALMEHVGELASFARREPRRIVLLGAPPSQPETEYGWIEPGELVGWAGQGPVHAIQRFRENRRRRGRKPCCAGEVSGIPSCLLRGRRWVLSAGREWAPALYDRLAPLRTFAGSEHERPGF